MACILKQRAVLVLREDCPEGCLFEPLTRTCQCIETKCSEEKGRDFCLYHKIAVLSDCLKACVFALWICLLVLIFAHLFNWPLPYTYYKTKILALKFLLAQNLQNWKGGKWKFHSHDYYKFILNLISKHPILGKLWPFTSNLKYTCVYFPNPIHCFHSIFILSISYHVAVVYVVCLGS